METKEKNKRLSAIEPFLLLSMILIMSGFGITLESEGVIKQPLDKKTIAGLCIAGIGVMIPFILLMISLFNLSKRKKK